MWEKIGKLLENFKTVYEILQGVGSPYKMAGLVLVMTVLVLWIVGSWILEHFKSLKESHEGLMKLEERFPRFFGVLYGGKIRFFLLAIAICFFLGDWRDATTVSPPIVKAPPAPIVQFFPPSVPAQRSKGGSQINTDVKQRGNGNTANPGIISAPVHVDPCGVIQNGGNNNFASTNCGPPEPQIENFEIVPAATSAGENGKAKTAFRFTLSAPVSDQKFVAICSRPCKALWAISSPPLGMSMGSDVNTGSWPDSPTLAAWMINIPMHADQFWVFTVESNDSIPVSIERFAIAKFQIKPQ